MSKPVGGRGKKVPYECRTVKVPEPVIEEVRQIIEDYRNSVIKDEKNESKEKSS